MLLLILVVVLLLCLGGGVWGSGRYGGAIWSNRCERRDAAFVPYVYLGSAMLIQLYFPIQPLPS